MIVFKHKLKVILLTLTLTACGGGSNDDSPQPNPAISIHISGNDKALLTNQANNSNTYTIDMRQQGVMSTGGDTYNISLTNSSPDITISTNSCNMPLALGGSCQFTVLANNASTTPSRTNNYTPESVSVGITATNTNTGEIITKALPIQVLPDPLGANIIDATGNNIRTLLGESYHTSNISEEILNAWRTPAGAAYIFTYNVPFIRTYYGDIDNLPLAMLTRCGNTLIYFVAQQKMSRALSSNQDDNVTVKYHPLIADGSTTGVTGFNKLTNGNLVLKEAGQADLTQPTSISVHDSLWSGPENIDRLKHLITSNVSNHNDYIVSILTNISGDPFIEHENVGATRVITVHSLLTDNAYDALVAYLSANHSVGDIVNIANGVSTLNLGSVALTDNFRDSLNSYRQQVSYACHS